MSRVESYEALIVGGGKAGKTLAADLARAGQRVALVERGMIGGTCINVGCIPSKALRDADGFIVVNDVSRRPPRTRGHWGPSSADCRSRHCAMASWRTRQ